jgi:hypothetical protein
VIKKLIVGAIVLFSIPPAVMAQTAASFAGKWEGTFKMQRAEGEGDPRPVVFNLTPARPPSRCSSPTGRCSSSR